MVSMLIRRYMIGILPRYVIGQVARAFSLALLTMTTVFVLVMVFAEASKLGLTPQDISRLVPYIVPSSLPYTVPVSLLFAVSVVYGRLAGDNEVIAVKAAGLGTMTVLLPSLVGAGVLSLGLYGLNTEAIPRCNKAIKDMLYRNFEDFFFKRLGRVKEFNEVQMPYHITVKGVEGHDLIQPTFMHKVKGENAGVAYDAVAIADRARVEFDLKAGLVRLSVANAQFTRGGPTPEFFFVNNQTMELPLPFTQKDDLKVQEMTTAELASRHARRAYQIRNEKKRQAMAASLWIASGRMPRVAWPEVRGAIVDTAYWEQDKRSLETERHARVSLAMAAFFFVFLGAPVGIRFAKRDFLSAFITCFLPIILLYYPLTLLGINLGKEGQLNPALALAMGNLLLGLLAGLLALPPVLRH